MALLTTKIEDFLATSTLNNPNNTIQISGISQMASLFFKYLIKIFEIKAGWAFLWLLFY